MTETNQTVLNKLSKGNFIIQTISHVSPEMGHETHSEHNTVSQLTVDAPECIA